MSCPVPVRRKLLFERTDHRLSLNQNAKNTCFVANESFIESDDFSYIWLRWCKSGKVAERQCFGGVGGARLRKNFPSNSDFSIA